jgi:hypothetical protein
MGIDHTTTNPAKMKTQGVHYETPMTRSCGKPIILDESNTNSERSNERGEIKLGALTKLAAQDKEKPIRLVHERG